MSWASSVFFSGSSSSSLLPVLPVINKGSQTSNKSGVKWVKATQQLQYMIMNKTGTFTVNKSIMWQKVGEMRKWWMHYCMKFLKLLVPWNLKLHDIYVTRLSLRETLEKISIAKLWILWNCDILRERLGTNSEWVTV